AQGGVGVAVGRERGGHLPHVHHVVGIAQGGVHDGRVGRGERLDERDLGGRGGEAGGRGEHEDRVDRGGGLGGQLGRRAGERCRGVAQRGQRVDHHFELRCGGGAGDQHRRS